MSKTTLDEIVREHRGRVMTYDELYRKRHHDMHRRVVDFEHADRVSKQAILRWVADEVIGENDWAESEHDELRNISGRIRNFHREEQRKILAQHGYKGDQR